MWVGKRGGFRAVNNCLAENERGIQRHGNLLAGGKNLSQSGAAATPRAGGGRQCQAASRW